MKKGIDVSKHNGVIDFQKVKAAGYDFVIIRAGYGKSATQKDTMFDLNYAKAKAAGLDVGAYWYSYAMSFDEGRAEATACLDVIKGKQFEYPIYFDLEEQKQFAKGKDFCSQLVRTFCAVIEDAGYWAGLYTSKSYLTTHIDAATANKYALWVAQWAAKCTYTGSYGMWQKSETGKVSGINGNVDLDECYLDYPKAVREKGLNGYQKQNAPTVKVEYEVSVSFDTKEKAQAFADLLKNAKIEKVTKLI